MKKRMTALALALAMVATISAFAATAESEPLRGAAQTAETSPATAEAAKAAFELIKSKLAASKETGKGSEEKGLTCVIATVEGDIHDIGKNIVKLLLENYGFKVIDLGKDVPAETVLKAVELHKAELVGLSALMTTTVPAMEETIRLLHEKASWAKIVVGGAVLNQTYADSIKADKYAKDAMETVRYAESMQPK